MAKPFVPWSKEKHDRFIARGEALRQATDRVIAERLDALRQGPDAAAALDAAAEQAAQAKVAAAGPDLEPLLEPRRTRVDGWSADMQRAFIRALADTGSVSHAARAVGVQRSTAYAMRHRAGHSTFAIAWDVAVQLGRKRLLDVAMERAIEGQEVAVWYRGEQVGTRTVFNDRLLTFLIGHTPPAAHSAFSPEELAAMFDSMLDRIDLMLPHPLAVRLNAERAAAEAQAEEHDM